MKKFIFALVFLFVLGCVERRSISGKISKITPAAYSYTYIEFEDGNVIKLYMVTETVIQLHKECTITYDTDGRIVAFEVRQDLYGKICNSFAYFDYSDLDYYCGHRSTCRLNTNTKQNSL